MSTGKNNNEERREKKKRVCHREDVEELDEVGHSAADGGRARNAHQQRDAEILHEPQARGRLMGIIRLREGRRAGADGGGGKGGYCSWR
jgi:hypothetical protein